MQVSSSLGVIVSGSSATLSFARRNTSPQIVCSESKITLQAISDASLEGSASGTSGGGMGTREKGRCNSLFIMNVSVVAQAGADSAAIGTGRAGELRRSVRSQSPIAPSKPSTHGMIRSRSRGARRRVGLGPLPTGVQCVWDWDWGESRREFDDR
jgi:hypothetical protein